MSPKKLSNIKGTRKLEFVPSACFFSWNKHNTKSLFLFKNPIWIDMNEQLNIKCKNLQIWKQQLILKCIIFGHILQLQNFWDTLYIIYVFQKFVRTKSFIVKKHSFDKISCKKSFVQQKNIVFVK